MQSKSVYAQQGAHQVAATVSAAADQHCIVEEELCVNKTSMTTNNQNSFMSQLEDLHG